VRFQRAELHEETVSGTHMIPSLSIGPRTLLNDCNHSATAIFWRSAKYDPDRAQRSILPRRFTVEFSVFFVQCLTELEQGVVRIWILGHHGIRIHADPSYLITDNSIS